MKTSRNATVSLTKVIAQNTIEVTFKLPQEFNFTAGQYITLTLPSLKNQPDREQYRDFSITSAPKELPNLRIAFRQTNSLFKKTLAKLPVGAEVEIDGPAGVFTLPKPAVNHLVFVAGGIGITPLISMLKDRGSTLGVTVIYFNKTPKTMVYGNELEQFPGLSLINFYETPLKRHFEPTTNKYPNSLWYIAGPPPMVASVRLLLKALAVSDTMVRTEEFSGYETSQ